MNSRLFVLIFISTLCVVVKGQHPGFVNRYVSLMGHYGKTEIHSKHVNNLNGSNPTGFEFEIGKHLMTSKAMQTFGCYPRFGLSLNYWDFDYKEVGWGISAAAFFEPFLIFNPKFMWSIRGGAGLAWLSNPYSETNLINEAYSTHINFPLNIGMSFYKPITNNCAIKLTGSFQHLSNGAIKHPNYGINYTVISLGIDHSFKGYEKPPKSHTDGLTLPKNKRKERIETVLGVGPKDVSGEQFFMSFLQGRYIHQWTRINGWTTGALAEYDLSVKENVIDNTRLSVMAGHEFFFSNVGFSQEMGWYAYQPHSTLKRFFQLYSLHLKVTHSFRAGVCLKAHANVAEYVTIRLAYIFNINTEK